MQQVDPKASLNPAHSAVVEACAGSGKTWLLVSRMLRLLLAGAKPSELLTGTGTSAVKSRHNVPIETAISEKAMNADRITIVPAICHGKPCIRGLGHPVESILATLSVAAIH